MRTPREMSRWTERSMGIFRAFAPPVMRREEACVTRAPTCWTEVGRVSTGGNDNGASTTLKVLSMGCDADDCDGYQQQDTIRE